MKFNNDKCPERQPPGFSGLSQKKKKGRGGKRRRYRLVTCPLVTDGVTSQRAILGDL